MKRTVPFLFTLVLLLASSAIVAQATVKSVAAKRVKISGLVIDSTSGKPLEFATIMLRDSVKNVAGGYTDASVKLPRSGLQERFDNAMQCEKLYLQPCITRQSVAATLGTNVTYLSRAIREGYDMTFSEYLEHAKQILLRDNETKIEAIAI